MATQKQIPALSTRGTCDVDARLDLGRITATRSSAFVLFPNGRIRSGTPTSRSTPTQHRLSPVRSRTGPYVWQSRGPEAWGTRVFVALRDTSPDPNPETVRTVIRLVLATGAD